MKKIGERKHYAILADETADLSGIEQMYITIRTIAEDLEAEEHVVGLYSLEQCNSEYISTALGDVLQRLNLPITNARTQCYDGAAVMSGAFHGVSAILSKLESRALYTHCKMHFLNLAVKDTISNCQIFRNSYPSFKT